MDVTRALLLPDYSAPSDHLLLNLALYWDQIVWARPDLMRVDESSVRARLSACGVLSEVPQAPVPLDQYLEPYEGHDRPPRPGETLFLAHGKDEQGRKVIKRLWLNREKIPPPYVAEGMNVVDDPYAFGAMLADQFVAQVGEALALCARNNLAPLSQSAASHLASLVGLGPPGVPSREAALLSAVVTTFEVAVDSPIDDVLTFREKHADSMARFRASLGDLAGRLSDDIPADAALSHARDVIRNRVEPALGELEDVLAASRLKFVWKAALGASAITLAPVTPVVAAHGSAHLVGQTLDYTFSKEALVRSHPYGYLHQLASALPVTRKPAADVVTGSMETPRDTLREFFHREWVEGRYVRRLMGR